MGFVDCVVFELSHTRYFESIQKSEMMFSTIDNIIFYASKHSLPIIQLIFSLKSFGIKKIEIVFTWS